MVSKNALNIKKSSKTAFFTAKNPQKQRYFAHFWLKSVKKWSF